LEDSDGGTKLSYTVEANVGGKIAQVGSRLIDMTAIKMADIFFGKFSELVAPKDIPREKDSKPESENITNKKTTTKYSSKSFLYYAGITILLGIIAFFVL
jgi:Uncharacterized conserved protein